jgi:hypothetical protein
LSSSKGSRIEKGEIVIEVMHGENEKLTEILVRHSEGKSYQHSILYGTNTDIYLCMYACVRAYVCTMDGYVTLHINL